MSDIALESWSKRWGVLRRLPYLLLPHRYFPVSSRPSGFRGSVRWRVPVRFCDRKPCFGETGMLPQAWQSCGKSRIIANPIPLNSNFLPHLFNVAGCLEFVGWLVAGASVTHGARQGSRCRRDRTYQWAPFEQPNPYQYHDSPWRNNSCNYSSTESKVVWGLRSSAGIRRQSS